MRIFSIGIGPGNERYLTPEALNAIKKSNVIVGYTPYFEYIEKHIGNKTVISTGMKKERQRAEAAIAEAEKGNTVAVISSGDSGVYGMAPLLWEMKTEKNSKVEITVVAGISAMFLAAAKLGAPLGHDFCSISLSDLLTPWHKIEKRINAAADADFVTAIYNPLSKGRFWQLMRLREIFIGKREKHTPVGIVRNAGRKDERITVTTLYELNNSMADMFTVIIIGNSQTYATKNKMITPRGYYEREVDNSDRVSKNDKIGRQIMNESFRTILKELPVKKQSLAHTWVALHCIHTTADFGINSVLELSDNVISSLHKYLYSQKTPVIVTDVSMVTKGIRLALVKQLGIDVKCYLNDERTKKLAEEQNITRTQAGIRLAIKEHPNALFAFGNAPTALIELVTLIRNKKANPVGVIAAPVGFVNVKESKWQLKFGCPQIPFVIVNGRKGGSNLAATIINAILSWNEAENMHPGEGV
jgi:precorrin-3B C17-methyltransferase